MSDGSRKAPAVVDQLSSERQTAIARQGDELWRAEGGRFIRPGVYHPSQRRPG